MGEDENQVTRGSIVSRGNSRDHSADSASKYNKNNTNLATSSFMSTANPGM